MLIRTQNKRGLVVVENCDSICIQEKLGTRFVDVYAYNGSEEDGIYLGGYTNAAKAEKVLDMIQEAYLNTTTVYIQLDTKVDCLPKATVFFMPEDSEV